MIDYSENYFDVNIKRKTFNYIEKNINDNTKYSNILLLLIGSIKEIKIGSKYLGNNNEDLTKREYSMITEKMDNDLKKLLSLEKLRKIYTPINIEYLLENKLISEFEWFGMFGNNNNFRITANGEKFINDDILKKRWKKIIDTINESLIKYDKIYLIIASIISTITISNFNIILTFIKNLF